MKKKKQLSKPGLQFQFFFICMVAYAGTALLAELAAWLLKRWLNVTVALSTMGWALLFSLGIGGAITTYITWAFFRPVTQLEKKMKEVASGNFQVAAETQSRLPDVKSLYDSFNRMVKELGATETLQTDFISSVSHEFKTPINAIEGYAALLQDHQQSTEEQQVYIDKILLNTRRLSALTGNILLLSKLSSQSIHPQCTAFRLDEQVRQAIVALENRWTEKDMEFDVELDETEYTGYENLLIHVWTNLLDNAIKFAPRGGLIRLRLGRQEETMRFTIADNGPGVPEEDRERIFHKFYQSDLSREMEGNGLGLALVRQIVQISGGRVWVENLPEGGCRFTVELPEIGA